MPSSKAEYVVYHGTDVKSANLIIGPPGGIDVTLGGGELGRGFYAGAEPFMANSLAKGKYKETPAALQITLDLKLYSSLSIKTLRTQDVLFKKWKMLIAKKTTMTHLYGTDLVVAPFATFDFNHQYKFESRKAQDLLNRSEIVRYL